VLVCSLRVASMADYTLIDDLTREIQVTGDQVMNRTILRNNRAKIELFALASGQELSTHAAPAPAIVQILQGEARFTVASDEQELSPGSWLYMEANVWHAVYARTDVIMLVTILS